MSSFLGHGVFSHARSPRTALIRFADGAFRTPGLIGLNQAIARASRSCGEALSKQKGWRGGRRCVHPTLLAMVAIAARPIHELAAAEAGLGSVGLTGGAAERIVAADTFDANLRSAGRTRVAFPISHLQEVPDLDLEGLASPEDLCDRLTEDLADRDMEPADVLVGEPLTSDLGMQPRGP